MRENIFSVGEFSIAFFPKNTYDTEPYVILGFGLENKKITVRQFIREMTPAMLEAFELIGESFAL